MKWRANNQLKRSDVITKWKQAVVPLMRGHSAVRQNVGCVSDPWVSDMRQRNMYSICGSDLLWVLQYRVVCGEWHRCEAVRNDKNKILAVPDVTQSTVRATKILAVPDVAQSTVRAATMLAVPDVAQSTVCAIKILAVPHVTQSTVCATTMLAVPDVAQSTAYPIKYWLHRMCRSPQHAL